MTTDIRERLGGFGIEIAPETAAVHQGAIEAELRSPSPIPPRRLKRRRLPVVVLTALLVVGLSAAGAVAAETALPGDSLYPVKQATEWIRSWIDPTIPADHRIDELEVLLDHRAAHEAISDQLRRAEDAVARVSIGDAVVDAPLVDRLDRVRDLVPPKVAVEDDALPDRPTADTPPASDEPGAQDGPAADRHGDADGAGNTVGDHRRAELEAWCEKVVAATDRGERVPQWMLRRCHNLISSGDTPRGP